MSKFNQSTKGTTKTTNHEGAPAYKLSSELALYSAVVTSLLSEKYYETDARARARLKKLIVEVKPEFVAKLAVYAREQMNLRSIPLFLVTELAKIHNGDRLVSRATSRVVARADEITELLACYAQANPQNAAGAKKLAKISKQIRHGLEESFNKFNEYQFAKYNRDGEVKLRDALFLVRPKAKSASQQDLFDKIANNTLATPDTWEVELSASSDKKASWERLIEENRLGYMALLRNLRNILSADVSPAHIQKVCDKLSDPEEVRNSKQFPFRFYSAYREIQHSDSASASQVLTAIESALKASADNITGFGPEEKIIIASDVSGSMNSPVSGKSKIQMYDIGLVLSMLLAERSANVVTGIFGDKWKIKNFPKGNILANVAGMQHLANEVGTSTNGHLVLEDLIARNQVFDKVVFFTDMQMYDTTTWFMKKSLKEVWKQYKQIAPNAKLYVFDLAGYGTTPISVTSNDAYLVAGWSDRIFDMLDACENGETVVGVINSIEL